MLLPHVQSASIVPGQFFLHGGSGEQPHKRRTAKAAGSKTRQRKAGHRILLIGRIRELALYRAEVLKQRGFMVAVPSRIEDAIQIMRNQDFDAVVLSYTLPNDVVQLLASVAREYCPDCPIIAITQDKVEDRLVVPDATAIADEGPKALLSALHSVLAPPA